MFLSIVAFVLQNKTNEKLLFYSFYRFYLRRFKSLSLFFCVAYFYLIQCISINVLAVHGCLVTLTKMSVQINWNRFVPFGDILRHLDILSKAIWPLQMFDYYLVFLWFVAIHFEYFTRDASHRILKRWIWEQYLNIH